jgi:tryptophan-rich sensory protein
MSMTPDPEWRDLMEAWQSEAPEEAAPAPLSDEARRRIRTRVRRQSFLHILKAVSQVVTSLGVIVWMAFVLDVRKPVEGTAFVFTCVFVAIGFGFSFWNFRGTWWPAAESTSTFIDLTLRRSQRKLVSLRFCYGFLAGELVFMIPWSVWALLSRPDPWAPGGWVFAFGWMALFVGGMVLWVSWYRKKTLREIAEWEELRQGLG